MQAKTIRYWLHNFESLGDEIRELEAYLKQLRMMAVPSIRIPVIEVNSGIHGSGQVSSIVESIVISRLEHIARLEEDLFYKGMIYISIRQTVISFERMDPVKCKLLEMRYFRKEQGKRCPTWDQIGDKLGYSVQHCYRMDNEIVSSIQTRWSKNTIKKSKSGSSLEASVKEAI